MYKDPVDLEAWHEAAGKDTGETKHHTLNTDQFGDENLTPEQRQRYDRAGRIKAAGGDPVEADPLDKKNKPKYGDESNPLPPGGRSEIRPPKPPTPEQASRRLLRTAKTLGRLAKTAQGRRR